MHLESMRILHGLNTIFNHNEKHGLAAIISGSNSIAPRGTCWSPMKPPGGECYPCPLAKPRTNFYRCGVFYWSCKAALLPELVGWHGRSIRLTPLRRGKD